MMAQMNTDMHGAIAKQEPEAVVLSAQPLAVSDPESILRYALDRGAGVDVIERLMAVRDKLQAEANKSAFDAAMRGFRADAPVILKEKSVPDRTGRTAYKFAPIESVEMQILNYEQKHGLAHTFPRMANDGKIISVVCRVSGHGHWEDTCVSYRLANKTQLMSDTQQDAATETFCKRRALCSAYGLILAGEDVDGGTGRVKPAGPSSVRAETNVEAARRELWTLLKDVRGAEQNWAAANQWLWDEAVIDPSESAPNFSPERFAQVIEKARTKLAARNA